MPDYKNAPSRPLDVPEGKSISSEDRARAVAFLKATLDGPHVGTDPTNLLSYNPASNGERTFIIDEYNHQSPSNDQQRLALKVAQELHPGAFGNVKNIYINNDDGVGGAFYPTHRNMEINPNSPSTNSFERTMSTIRHELGHAVGFDDEPPHGIAGSYDIGSASNLLHRDIELPPAVKALKKVQ